MKISGIAAKWLFILCLPVLLLTASLSWAANSLWLYKYGAERYNVSQKLADSGLELTDLELERVYAELISYFNSDEEYVSLTVVKDNRQFSLFTPEEVIHFKDVKGLIWLDYRVLLGTLVYVLGYAAVSLWWRRKIYWRRLAWGVVGGGGITLAVILALGLGALSGGFGKLFNQFHLLFFSNEYWSAKGYMLLLFQEDFFRDAAISCALFTAGLAVILGGVGGWYLLFTRKRTAC